jgi:hypothetical protein
MHGSVDPLLDIVSEVRLLYGMYGDRLGTSEFGGEQEALHPEEANWRRMVSPKYKAMTYACVPLVIRSIVKGTQTENRNCSSSRNVVVPLIELARCVIACLLHPK